MSKELIERLRELSASRKPYATGAHGQMVGMESYRIVANGFALECIDEAADRIEELERELAAERKRASSYKLLVSSMEKQKDIHLAERIKFRESLATLDSERAANERLTQERDALQADNARLRDKFEHVLEYWNGDENYRAMSDALNHIEDVVSEALAATPEQSLARIRNQVLEECALEADRQSEDEPYGHAKFRCANIALEIRAMKEQP